MTVVIDTDVMVAALESPSGASRAVLLAVIDRRIRMACSPSLLFEYESVLTRPHILARAKVSTKDVEELLDEVSALCIPVAFDYRWRPIAEDPDDDLVIETAVNGGVNFITTFNLRDIRTGAARFGIPAVRPAELLRRIGP